MRYSCLLCTLKHLGQASALITEAYLGYPLHKWLAIGHMAEAEAESVLDYPELSSLIRQQRTDYMEDRALPDIIGLIELASDIANAETNTSDMG